MAQLKRIVKVLEETRARAEALSEVPLNERIHLIHVRPALLRVFLFRCIQPPQILNQAVVGALISGK